MDFDEAKKTFDSLGVNYTQYKVGLPRYAGGGDSKFPLFESIQLPLNEIEWCHLCMRDGDDYLGGCCGNCGYIQDRLNSIFRNTGWLRCAELGELITDLEAHNGLPIPSTQVGKFDTAYTWEKIKFVWELVQYNHKKIPYTQLIKIRGSGRNG